MSHNTLPTVAELSGEMRERLAKVKYVFTDLDATMLAPGSCVLRDNDGNISATARQLGMHRRTAASTAATTMGALSDAMAYSAARR